jgi:hypothetical protein
MALSHPDCRCSLSLIVGGHQRYSHRFFAKFIRPACAHGSSPLLHNM